MSFARLNGADRLQGHVTEIGVAETLETYEYVLDIWSGGKNNCTAADLVSSLEQQIFNPRRLPARLRAEEAIYAFAQRSELRYDMQT